MTGCIAQTVKNIEETNDAYYRLGVGIGFDRIAGYQLYGEHAIEFSHSCSKGSSWLGCSLEKLAADTVGLGAYGALGSVGAMPRQNVLQVTEGKSITAQTKPVETGLKNPSGDVSISANSARNQPYGNGASASPRTVILNNIAETRAGINSSHFSEFVSKTKGIDGVGSAIRGGIANFGKATSNDYKATFFKANPELKNQVVVHHAVEQQVLKRYSGIVTEAEIHSLENLRGIPKAVNSDLHLSKIRREWNEFYRQNPNPTKQDLLNKATEIDRIYGSQFNPSK